MPRPKKAAHLRTRVFKVRLTDDEWHELSEQAARAALTPSEYVRRRLNGHRIVSRVEDHLVNELRRLGGLQKHLAPQYPEMRSQFNAVVNTLLTTIRHIDAIFAASEEEL